MEGCWGRALSLMARKESFQCLWEYLCRVWHRREPGVFCLSLLAAEGCPDVLFQEVVDKEEDGSQ